MRWILHLITSTMLFGALWVIFPQITISVSLAGIIIATWLPDIVIEVEEGDINYKLYFSHSIILWTFIFVFNMYPIIAVFILAIAFHDTCDIKAGTPDRPRTHYNMWLFGNACVGIIIFLLYLVSLMR